MRARGPSPAGGRLYQFGPIVVALGYALARHLPGGLSLDDLYWQSPFAFTALSGLAIAYACRPVLSRIQWTRPVAFAVGLALLAGLGPPGDWLLAAGQVLAGVGTFPFRLARSPLPLLAGVLVAAALMAVCYRPPGGRVDAAALRDSLRSRLPARWTLHLALLAALAVVLWLLPAWLDARWEERATDYYVPLVYPNPWLRLEGLWGRDTPPAGPLGAGLLLVLLWARGALAVGALLPVAALLRGSWPQLTLVFALLLFVVGEFAPLMVDQPYPSAAWLMLRTALALARAAVLGGAVAAFLGRRRAAPSPP